MKSSLFARPNLKIFLLGALGLLLINDMFNGSPIQASARTIPMAGKSGKVTHEELSRLLDHAKKHPSVEAYIRISYCYQRLESYPQAVEYLKRAEHLSQIEEDLD